LENVTGRKFGDPANPLLLSVRSGAAISMPGMMDTILNPGINQSVAEGIADQLGDEHFALDLYRRFIQMHANVVMPVPGSRFEEALENLRNIGGVDSVVALSSGDLHVVIDQFRRIVQDAIGSDVPEEPIIQLRHAVEAVFSSWNTRRAVDYRNFNGIPHDPGTAVNVQAMVFGNMDDESSTGVLFTRDPATGNRALYGEYPVNAQGEDLVAGIATPRNIETMAIENPGMHRQLVETCEALERHYRDA
jgi:pyruvate,orthophosphate dikinase